MLTTSEIATQKFDKSIGGYRVEEVDSFLRKVADDYGALCQEKDNLERKLEVLAEKLIEYREDEESLRTALLGAQKLGDSVIRESRTKAEIILRDATIKAERLVENAQKQMEHERIGLERLQSEVAGFKNRLLGLYKQHLEIVSALPGEVEEIKPVEKEPPAPPARVKTDSGSFAPNAEKEPVFEPVKVTPAEPLDSDAHVFDDELLPFEALPDFSVSPKVEEADEDAGESLDSVFADEDPKVPESRFGSLRFGEGYDMTYDEGRKKRR